MTVSARKDSGALVPLPLPWCTCASASPTTRQCPRTVVVLQDGFNEADQISVWCACCSICSKGREACPVTKDTLQLVCWHTLEQVDGNVEAMAYTCDPTKADGHQEPEKKRRRIDADYKKASTSIVIESGRASSSSSFLRADAVVESKRASECPDLRQVHDRSMCWFSLQMQADLVSHQRKPWCLPVQFGLNINLQTFLAELTSRMPPGTWSRSSLLLPRSGPISTWPTCLSSMVTLTSPSACPTCLWSRISWTRRNGSCQLGLPCTGMLPLQCKDLFRTMCP